VRVGSKIDIVSIENNPNINRRYGIHISRPELITPDLIKVLNQHAVLNSSNVKSISLDDVNKFMENIMTIKAKTVKQLLIQPYDFSAFEKEELATINPDELRVLQTTLSTFSTDVLNYQAQLEKKKSKINLQKLKYSKTC
jgi:antitoxin component HigA of HigAB toxin-antitoxin module